MNVVNNTFTAYATEAERTAPMITGGTHEDELLVGALGLAGEGGEYANLIKKQIYHQHPADREKALEELGDILWYLAHATRRWGSSLGEIAYINNIKLRKRFPEGFSSERSINRAE